MYSHELGLCGGFASLCGACEADERADLTAWARTQPAPLPGEDAGTYWRRIGGRMLDAWWDVASELCRAVPR